MGAALHVAWRGVEDIPATLRRLSRACENSAARALLDDGSARSLRALALQGYAIVSVARPAHVALATLHELRETWPVLAGHLPVGSTLFVLALSSLDAEAWALRPIEATGDLGPVRSEGRAS